MKKKLLFVTQYLHTGGVEKSLLTLLSDLDYEKYDVDLLLFDHSGVLFHMVPSRVNILPPLFACYSTPLTQAVPQLVKEGRFRLLAGKLLAAVAGKLSKGVGVGARWSVYRHALPNLRTHYDVAISYLDFFCNYYVAEKVIADKKIVYNHMDYAYSQLQGWPCPRLERKSFLISDYIVTVAETARKSLEGYFPEFAQKMRVIKNRVSADTVHKMSNEPGFTDESKGIRIVTVARLTEEKGVWFALDTCAKLVREGYDIRWYLIGNGPLRGELEAKSRELGLEKNFMLLGEKQNPYPFMKGCDIYVQPSKTEAHCIAVEEAIALYRPIVVTDIPSFKQQIVDGETGLIVQANIDGLAEGIKKLFHSLELRQQLSAHLSLITNRHQEEMNKFYQLIEG
ncbi:glycosyltransferase [Paenibacillus sp. H1-7]|uniref:glycosyltransferase n=1 Tax=Paenibacillus sp. H1-7 TaxID=2282849 RepID=UPI001EF7552B|nr:glycosyltransferase [Paenibacillus sp. H1-7]ULL13910.1 glycosyltransferase [Paenibacillus sp. H1-7]